MKTKTKTDARARWGSLLAMLVGLASCEQSRPCLAYACYSGVTMTWKHATAAGGVFDVQLCQGDRCEELAVTVPNDTTQACDDGSTLGGEPGGVSACVVRDESNLVFSASWTYNEGRPRDKTFGIRIVDRGSGGVLLDTTREVQFQQGPSLDDCHDCWSASVDLGEG